MTKYIIIFITVQIMFVIIALTGGVQFGTFNAGFLCALSFLVGVVACLVKLFIHYESKSALNSKKS